jgi:hypothetical protein
MVWFWKALKSFTVWAPNMAPNAAIERTAHTGWSSLRFSILTLGYHRAKRMGVTNSWSCFHSFEEAYRHRKGNHQELLVTAISDKSNNYIVEVDSSLFKRTVIFLPAQRAITASPANPGVKA